MGPKGGNLHDDACGAEDPQNGKGLRQHDTFNGPRHRRWVQEEPVNAESLIQPGGWQTQKEFHSAHPRAQCKRGKQAHAGCKEAQLDGGGDQRVPAR